MRHRKKGRHFSRTAEHRGLMLRNMASALFLHGRIETTLAKAKELRRFAEPLITKAKRGDLHARRLVARRITDGAALSRLFDELAPRYAQRPGGYTRVRHLGHRPGDAADMAIIELVD
ncbi:MAG: 50S ribosomal protein L17 [Gemmatimonadetes bacterium]|nr:50S ribosomal protein L17 [Gemmatimonadota bacterium]